MSFHKIAIKNKITSILYEDPIETLNADISILILKNAQLQNDTLNKKNLYYYLYFKGKKYFSKKATLQDLLNNGTVEHVHTRLHKDIKPQLIKLIKERTELLTEKNMIMGYLTRVLNISHNMADIINLLPASTTSLINSKIIDSPILNIVTVKEFKIQNGKYSKMLNERIIINLIT